MTDFSAARTNMVKGQIKPSKATDHRILAAMLTVPREQFVPKAMRGVAYIDGNVRIGSNRYLIEARVLARLLQELQIGCDDIVLDIGIGTGYSTAILAKLANTVVAVENDPDLSRQATQLLAQLGADNAAVMTGPLAEGYQTQRPYQAILFNGAVSEIPQCILSQLADGGKLAAVMRDFGPVGKAVLFTRGSKETISCRELFNASVPFIPGFEPRPVFTF
jgi:protein-L-isoaspartate(D-aspartate) O-methyltransferase